MDCGHTDDGLVAKMVAQNKQENRLLSYSSFIKHIESGQVEEVTFKGKNTIIGRFRETYDNGNSFKLVGNTGEATIKVLENNIIENYEEEEKADFLTTLLVNWGYNVTSSSHLYFFLRQIQAGGGKAMSFGKSKAKMLNSNEKKITFDDVSGVQEAKEELLMIDF